MNQRQKEIQQQFLDNEQAVLKKLEGNYQDALDEINSKIELLMARQDADMQHVIYQVEYQKALKTQVQSILETLQTNEFETVSEYLANSYHDGFIGTMYDLQGQGIPLVFPIDQEMVVAAVQHETKLSENLYTALGKDITDLRKKIAGEISRGISGGQMYADITRNIASWARIPKNNAARIARTEAHRIQCKATADAQVRAKEKGADVVKQWDTSLDSKTRKKHRELDGQIRELDEPFTVNGHKAMQPGGFGRPEEDINCRCALLQRARWALGNDYTKWSPEAPVVISDDGTTQFTIIEAKNYKEFQQKYIKAAEQIEKKASERVRQGAQMMNDGRNRSGERKIRASKAQASQNTNNENTIEYKIEGFKEERQVRIKECYDDLMKEYNSPLKSVKRGAAGRGTRAATDMMGEEISLNTSDYTTMAHEFFHSMANTKRDKAGLSDHSAFWKEIKSIRRKYNSEVNTGSYSPKQISAYAGENLDEFAAECFGQYKTIEKGEKLGIEMGTDTTYSKQVVEVIDKYFKKESLEKSAKSSTIVSGAVSGARNPFGEKAKEHAQRYYGLVRSMKTDVAKISKVTGMSEEDVQAVKNFIFLEKHDLGGKELEYFEPDYMMAESWQRLVEGKPEQHDITLLKHEIMERELMKDGLSQEEAHIKTSQKYNYSKEAGEYYAKIEKFKKE